MACRSTRFRSEPNDGADARLLAVICFPHAENVTVRATRRVTHYNQTLTKEPEANDPLLAVVVALIFSLERRPSKDLRSVCKVQPAINQRQISLARVEGDFHPVNVSTKTIDDNKWWLMTQNVRAKRAATVGRQARAGENVPRTARLGLVACRWRSA